jgi:hypothetical protein
VTTTTTREDAWTLDRCREDASSFQTRAAWQQPTTPPTPRNDQQAEPDKG